MTDVQNTVSFSKNVNLNDDVDQNDFIEQMKQRLTIIEIEKADKHDPSVRDVDYEPVSSRRSI